MPTYRRLTKDEVLSLATRIRYEDDLDFAAIRKGIKALFGPTAHKATLSFDSEYNDEGYDLRPNDIKVWDAQGELLVRPQDEDGYDEELSEFFSDIEVSDVSESDSMDDITLFVIETKPLKLPDLYVEVAP